MKLKVDIKRAYEQPSSQDGYRVLVDRLWPRGISKSNLHHDAWYKDLAPSAALRKWFGHETKRWDEFCRKYQAELHEENQIELMQELIKAADNAPITLLYGARDTEHNQAVVLADELTKLAEK